MSAVTMISVHVFYHVNTNDTRHVINIKWSSIDNICIINIISGKDTFLIILYCFECFYVFSDSFKSKTMRYCKVDYVHYGTRGVKRL